MRVLRLKRRATFPVPMHARIIFRNILSAFEQAELARDDAERKRLLTFVIIGGGPTGVETQVTAIGPLGLEYREAQDDPRKVAHLNSRV
jgi:NADH:ubiquinone reductase (H+-translocating)